MLGLSRIASASAQGSSFWRRGLHSRARSSIFGHGTCSPCLYVSTQGNGRPSKEVTLSRAQHAYDGSSSDSSRQARPTRQIRRQATGHVENKTSKSQSTSVTQVDTLPVAPRSENPDPAMPDNGSAPLAVICHYMEEKAFDRAVNYFETHYDPSKHTLTDFCGSLCDVRDTVLYLMRAYAALGNMPRVRDVFLSGLRDLSEQQVLDSPSDVLAKEATGTPDSSPTAITLSSNPYLLTHEQQGGSEQVGGAAPIAWGRPSLLNATFFNAYLEVLTRRKNFDAQEVRFVLHEMKEANVQPNALTYHYLIELHVRAGYDPKALWTELVHQRGLQPLAATVQTVLLRVVPSSSDAAFVVEVTREALRHGSNVMDKRIMTELVEQWLHSSTSAGKGAASNLTLDASSASTIASGPSAVTSNLYAPEYIMWLMLEMEIRCVLDKVPFGQFIQQKHIAELLLRCARCGDAATATAVLALMDRHSMSKTADVFALMVWCLSQAVQVEAAVDMVELMARKGYLEQTDPFQRYVVDCLGRYTMERHFLMLLVDALSTRSLLERVLAHLRSRKQKGQPVSVHTLDLTVLAAGKLGDERKALHLVSTYPTEWGIQPQTSTYNALLVGCSATRGTALHQSIYETMLSSGVNPNAFTFRVLIRQAVLSDHIDDAIEALMKVTTHPGLRVEVEMILPILERAARAGDVETVKRVSQFSLDCDIGIDGAVLQTVMKHLTEAGQDVEVIKGHQKLHEALRSRSKVGRQRARSEITL